LGRFDVASFFSVLGKNSRTLSEQLHLAQELIEVLPVAVFFKGRDGKYLGVNKAWEEFFGISRAAFVGKTVQDLYPQSPGVAEKHYAMDQDLWNHPGSQHYEIPVTTRDGRIRHTIYYKATFAGTDGGLAGLIGTIVDITERKHAEQRQAIGHAVTRLLAESDTLAEAIRGIIQAMCEQMGWVCGARWSLEEDGKSLRCVENWAVPDPAIAAFLAASRSVKYVSADSGLVRRVAATGKPVWIADVTEQKDFLRRALAAEAGLRGAFAVPILLGSKVLGTIDFYSREVSHFDDWLLQLAVTVGNQIGQLMARRQAEAAMRESEARFRSLTELSSDWYWEQDRDFRFTVLSRGIFDAIGIRPEEFIGKKRWDFQVTGLSEAEWAAHKARLEARQPFQDFEYGRPDTGGRLRYISISGEPVFDEDGNFKGYRGLGKDITVRKMAEAELREAHDELARRAQDLARSNAELQQFAYVASHDLQEPLRMVSSYTQLLLRRYAGMFDSDAKEFMAFIVDGAARMKQLIEDLLAYSRVGTRGQDLQPTACTAALEQALANLRASIESTGATVTHDALPVVTADDSQLVQLFQNLIGNAIKFRGAEAPRIHVGVREKEGEWVFSVRDNGIGIDPRYFERIFVIFQRLHSKAEYPGTGIGLAICKKIVDRHGGRIRVESRPGQGSTFYCTLPKVQRGVSENSHPKQP
jgi:PAS domain S-box-containing protein